MDTKRVFSRGKRTMHTKLALLALSVSLPAAAQQHRVLVGFPPGGVIDLQARAVAERLREVTGQPFIVETRAGATGRIAVGALLQSKADGNTLLVTPDSHLTIYPHLVRKRPYSLADFAPVAHAGDYRMALAVSPTVPAADLRSFIAWTQKQAGNVGYGTPGAGGTPHFYGVLLGQVTGARLTHVPYKGTGPAINDLVGGHVPAAVVPLGSLLPNAKSGKLRILGNSGEGRSPAAPDVPTFRELGYPALSDAGWYVLLTPAGTPPDMVRRYNDVVVQMLQTPEMAKRMREWQLDTRKLTAAQVTDMIRADSERWAAVVKSSGFTPASD